MGNGGSLGHHRGDKGRDAFRTISEVADQLDLQQHVLRFWETKFRQVSPLKRGGGRRYYRPQDVELLGRIKSLLHTEGYTIKGVQRMLGQGGLKNLPPLNDDVAKDVATNVAETKPRALPISAPEMNPSNLLAILGELEDIRDFLQESMQEPQAAQKNLF